MEAARPRRRRRRPRRGTVDRPLDARLVRVASLVVTPALLALLFSVSTTGTLPRHPALEPVFDASTAAALATQLSTEYPARVPGTTASADAASWFRGAISSLGLATEEHVWSESLPDLGRVELRNVVAVVPGRSDETIVLVAHRDNAGVEQPLRDNASGTAALIELARGYGPQESASAPLPQRTLVLVSTDAGAYGGAGAAYFARESPYADNAFAVIVLDGLGGPGRPRIALAGDRPHSPARTLVSTASARIAEQVGVTPAVPSVLTQLVDLGIPFAAGEQGPFLAREIAAITVTTDDPGDPGVPVGDSGAPLAVQRLGQLGRAIEALLGSIDASVGAAFRTPDRLFFDGRVASGWTVRLTLVAAVAPFVLGVLDLLARGRRRGLPFRPALRGLRARLLFWLYAGGLVWFGALTGIFPTGASLPLSPYSSFVAALPVAGIALLAIAFGLGWLVGRRRLSPAAPPASEERLAGYSVALAWLAGLAIVLAVVKPYALVFVLPSLYAWLWLPVRRRGSTRAAIYVLGLTGPIAGLVLLGVELGVGVLKIPFYVIGLVTVGYVSAGSVFVMLAWAAAAAQLAALAFGRYAPYAGGVEPPPPGVVRTSVAWLAQTMRTRRYARDT